MFKNTYQSGLLSILYSCGSDPLALWDLEVHNGHVKRLTDPEVNSLVLEIVGSNVATTYITCPRNNQSLGIKLPFLVMTVKNMKKYFSFEITILDDANMKRRFRISNFQSTTKIKPFCTMMPIGLANGWNQIQFNLSDFTRRAYSSQYRETLRVQVHANIRVRRIYFAERLYPEEELPDDYKLFLPLTKKAKKVQKAESIAISKGKSKTGPRSEAPPTPEGPPAATPEQENLQSEPAPDPQPEPKVEIPPSPEPEEAPSPAPEEEPEIKEEPPPVKEEVDTEEVQEEPAEPPPEGEAEEAVEPPPEE